MLWLDQTVLKYVEPAAQSWDGTETGDQLINTTVMGKVLLEKEGQERKEKSADALFFLRV